MPTPEELIAILERIEAKAYSEQDIAALRQSIQVQGNAVQTVSQEGKFNTTIGKVEGDGVQIGDRYYGTDVLDLLQPAPEIDWHQASMDVLQEQLKLTTNRLTTRQGIADQVDQIYVPLGLVERKQLPKRKEDLPPEQGSQFFKEDHGREWERESTVQITKQFEHEAFLNEVLRQGDSPNSQGKRIAIIGEPGAGKTTLLQRIARWVGAEMPGAIAIWVSLADVQQGDLKAYVLECWLTAVAEQFNQSRSGRAWENALIAQINQGKVWLLLDGLDEMPVTNPLGEIERQLRQGGVWRSLRIVLTCRLNLWDGALTALESFDSYRTLDFVYPNQVEQFIHQWFRLRSPEPSTQAERLCTALKESGRERIRDLVKNPLRLMLLCFNWYSSQRELPDTQAELYEQFVYDIYRWKQQEFPTTSEQQRTLNQKLAELSRDAIDQEPTRFRLRHEFVCHYLGDPDEPRSLFSLALKLGWLNRVGLNADRPQESVYAFLHPTFEEYFAALAIADWHFFLNHKRLNPLSRFASYRVFEPQWKQVFLLWLGRRELEVSQKEALIRALARFKDGCWGVYSDRAYLLAATGIREFKACSLADEIVERIVQWGLHDSGRIEQAKITWKETDTHRAISTLVRVLETTQNDEIRETAAESLGQIGLEDRLAISALVRVLETTQNDEIRETAAESLGQIDVGNELAIRELVQVLETTKNNEVRERAAESSGQISVGNDLANQELLYRLFRRYSVRMRAIKSLGKMGFGNELAIQELVRMLETKDDYIRREAIVSLGRIGLGNELAIQELVRVLETTWDNDTRWSAIESLKQIGLGNELAIQELVRVLETTWNNDARWSAAKSLGQISLGNELAIQELVRVLETARNDITRWRAAESLGQIDVENKLAIRELVRVIQTAQYDTIRWKAIASLGEIYIGNKLAIQALVEVLKTAQNDDTCLIAAESLGQIGAGNKLAIQALVEILKTPQNDKIYWIAAKNLWQIDVGNKLAIQALERLIKTTRNNIIFAVAAESLGQMDARNKLAIQALVKVIETPQNSATRRNAAESFKELFKDNNQSLKTIVSLLYPIQEESYELLLGCANRLPYPIFYQAYHARFYPTWLHVFIKFACRSGWSLILCFVAGLIAFPLALAILILTWLWRWTIPRLIP